MNKFFSYVKDFFDKIFNPKDILTEDEKLAFNIFETALYDDNCIRILNTNISGKKYIVPKTFYETNDTSSCIIINSYLNKITIVNHQYKYDILIPQKTCATIDIMFNNKVQKEREDLESEILKNTVQSLSTVLANFKDNFYNKNK